MASNSYNVEVVVVVTVAFECNGDSDLVGRHMSVMNAVLMTGA